MPYRSMGTYVATIHENAQHMPEQDIPHDDLENLVGFSEEWIATLCHELRSPLATILGALGVISEEQAGEGSTRALAVARRQALNALQIVDDLFDLCADSHEKLELRKKRVNLAELLAEAIETVSHLINSRGHRLTVSLPDHPIMIIVDRLRLEQVFVNLLTNAAKYTDLGGSIQICAASQSAHVVICVLDNGRGIAPDVLPGVFKRFQQGSTSEGQAGMGLGLGLALVKTIIELHGGCVSATSDGIGNGSAFTVRLPIQRACPDSDRK